MTDQELKKHVENALVWEPRLYANDLGISVEEGIVTLRGNILRVRAHEWHTMVPKNSIGVAVSNGRVTLKGRLAGHGQRDAAICVVKGLAGVAGVTSELVVREF